MSSIWMMGCVVDNKISQNALSPLNYGLDKARSGEERYYVLQRVHKDAVAKGMMVSYRGISKIDLEIPQDASPIPLSKYCDFGGTIFNVRNTKKEVFLFSIGTASIVCEPIRKELIDKGDFRSVKNFQKGRKLLAITDENNWVDNRSGYTYGHIRKDILLVNDGKAVNKVVMPYNNKHSSPKCVYYNVGESVVFKNISVNRRPGCSKKTYLLKIEGCDDVQIKNVNVYTDTDGQLTSDALFSIVNCTNVSLENVVIDGTYSRSDYSGYGISMNNVWRFSANRLKAHGKWGVFGTNNVSSVDIKNSDINRFDIHCYGRDVCFKNTTFRKLYNQFSSVYGTISFVGCEFVDFTPVLIEPSYNAYVPFNLRFENCTWDVTPSHFYLVSAGTVDDVKNFRSELSIKCWPNVVVRGLTINVPEKVGRVEMFYIRGKSSTQCKIGYISHIDVQGVVIKNAQNMNSPTFDISNQAVSTSMNVHVKVVKSNVEVRSRFE